MEGTAAIQEEASLPERFERHGPEMQRSAAREAGCSTIKIKLFLHTQHWLFTGTSRALLSASLLAAL